MMCPFSGLQGLLPGYEPVALEDRPAWMLDNIFDQLYDKGIPFVSSFGNHDWTFITNEHGYKPLDEHSNTAAQLLRNKLTMSFVDETYTRSAALPGSDFVFEKVDPTLEYGPPMYTAEFRGLQLATFGFSSAVRSFPLRCTTGPTTPCQPADGADSSEQMAAIEASLDTSKPALFYHHAPLSVGTDYVSHAAVEDVRRLIAKHPQAALLSGHQHSEFRRLREALSPETENSFYEYTAGYAHEGKFLALRVSPTRGVLEVKSLTVCFELVSLGISGIVQCKSGSCENGYCVPNSERKQACDDLIDPVLKGQCEEGKCLPEHCKRDSPRLPEQSTSCAGTGSFGAQTRNHDVCQSGYCGPSAYCTRLGMDTSDQIAVTAYRQILTPTASSTATTDTSTYTATTATATPTTAPSTTHSETTSEISATETSTNTSTSTATEMSLPSATTTVSTPIMASETLDIEQNPDSGAGKRSRTEAGVVAAGIVVALLVNFGALPTGGA
jgi:hypothetical protein